MRTWLDWLILKYREGREISDDDVNALNDFIDTKEETWGITPPDLQYRRIRADRFLTLLSTKEALTLPPP